jgi:hypothetical protein
LRDSTAIFSSSDFKSFERSIRGRAFGTKQQAHATFEEKDSSEKLIEVKTTVLGKFFPFFVTETGVRCSEVMAQQFRLFRLFDFARSPRLYVLKGSLREKCQLVPLLYHASI